MKNEQYRILAINPGSRYLSFAVFYGTDLREWRIRAMSKPSFKEKLEGLRSLISDVVGRYRVNTLATKKLHPSRSSNELKKLASRLKQLAKKTGLNVCELSIDEMKDFFFPNVHTNKRQLMEDIAARYPFLSHEFQRQQKSKNPYFIRMFETIALGVVCCSELECGKRKVGNYSK